MNEALPPIGDLAALVRTRESWHAVAEHVLAAARYRAEHAIGLVVVPGGFGTPTYGDGQSARVVECDVIVTRPETTTTVALTTVGRAAEAVGLEPGAALPYRPTTTLAPDAPLDLDADATRLLATFFELGWALLTDLVRGATADDAPVGPTLWPEHFDAAVEVGGVGRGTRGTYGASPGDAEHPQPYLYVTHWAAVADDEFWNDATFGGASLQYDSLAAASDPRARAHEFFARGRVLLSTS